MLLSILSLSWTEYLTCFELLGWCSWIPCSFESFNVGCVSICLFWVCLSCVSLVMFVMSLLCFTLEFFPGVQKGKCGRFWWVIIFPIPLAFVYPFDNCPVLNCSSLVCFHLLGFIGPLFWIWVNFTLFGLIFVFNYFQVFGWSNFGAWTLIFSWRELPHHCHIISTSFSRHLSKWANIWGLVVTFL